MTNEEAIEILKHEHDYAQLLSYVNEALKTAVCLCKKCAVKLYTEIVDYGITKGLEKLRGSEGE